MCIRDSNHIENTAIPSLWDISVQVGQTPQGWNGSIFNMIENLSNSIMVPLAGVILAIVMTVDPVSYTHLDVYKRQGLFEHANHRHRQPERRRWQNNNLCELGNRSGTGRKESASDRRGPTRKSDNKLGKSATGQAAIYTCLLYTSYDNGCIGPL